ncbi:MAG: Tm-1-like ATP-binding domain-containing protein, partial [Longimicrobiales bacterium]
MARTIMLIGTLDTKGEEYAYVRGLIGARGHDVLVMDLGILGEPAFAADIPAEEVARAGGSTLAVLRARADRGTAVD